MAAPAFDYGAWSARFPELGTPQVLATQLFAEATMLPEGQRVSNDATLQPAQQSILLNLMVAHLAAIAARNATPGGAVPGRISAATQGSVSVTFDYPASSEASAWWAQTGYGVEVWRMLAPYRRMQYAPGPGLYSIPNAGGFAPGLGPYYGPQALGGWGFW